MTYCIGWKSKNTVYLISDTARTVDDSSGKYKPSKLSSSLGEKSVYEKNTSVEEWLHKQFRIEDNFIISYAGDLDTSLEIIRNIKSCFIYADPLKSFELAIDSVRDFERPKNVKFLFGIKNNTEIKLFTYNYNGEAEIKVHYFAPK